jgi:hypothetical protein
VASEQVKRIVAALAQRREPVAEDRIAHLLGLAELRVGAGRAGGPEGDRRQLLAWWAVTVKPSFHPYFAVGAVHEEEWVEGPSAERVTVRGFVAGEPGAVTAALGADPIPDALGRLNPFRVEPAHRMKWTLHDPDAGAVKESWGEVATLDGLGYSVRWETKAARGGGFDFANPRAGWPLEFERILYRFARQVTIAGGVGEFEDALVRWRGYREGIDAAEPRSAPDTSRESC